MPNSAFAIKVKYQVGENRVRKSVWYKAMVEVVQGASVKVRFVGDTTLADLESDVLCNNSRFRYFDLNSDVIGIPNEADAPWEPPEDTMQVSTRVVLLGSLKSSSIPHVTENNYNYNECSM